MKKTYVLARQKIYKLKFIINIYLFNVINAVLFDSMTFFPIGWLLAGFITIMVEKSSDLCMYMMRLFGAPTSDIDYYIILYHCRDILVCTICIAAAAFVTLIALIIRNYEEQVL
jgi:hypothetical protein